MKWGKGNEEHKWFAWRPVRTELGKWIWLEYIYRTKYWIGWIYSEEKMRYF